MSERHVTLSLTLENLWQFSLQYYSVRAVKEACLSLQNRFNGNVNLILLLKYLDTHNVAIGDNDWHLLLECLHRSDVLLHDFRQLRRQLKTHVPDTIYRQSLEFELELEKQQQADLVECANHLTYRLRNEDKGLLTTRYCMQLTADNLADIFAKPVQNNQQKQ
ncbi:TIGR02444 family protein [Vibrio viridaestus]|uniref:TIGR02444 family protein n=1 Tax=Vibrio viridaestus TaxID=2487322 RepID=A0A3N9TD66_9VIBR|nr:TIGR02444 family protein [Vibrio viridaestus]RQW61633.1 TIGR02444 family protein [Vibrio viridaestus]